jgi:hypothetical protein
MSEYSELRRLAQAAAALPGMGWFTDRDFAEAFTPATTLALLDDLAATNAEVERLRSGLKIAESAAKTICEQWQAENAALRARIDKALALADEWDDDTTIGQEDAKALRAALAADTPTTATATAEGSER